MEQHNPPDPVESQLNLTDTRYQFRSNARLLTHMFFLFRRGGVVSKRTLAGVLVVGYICGLVVSEITASRQRKLREAQEELELSGILDNATKRLDAASQDSSISIFEFREIYRDEVAFLDIIYGERLQ